MIIIIHWKMITEYCSLEIRTPLAGITGMISLLSEGTAPLMPESRELIRTAQLCVGKSQPIVAYCSTQYVDVF